MISHNTTAFLISFFLIFGTGFIIFKRSTIGHDSSVSFTEPVFEETEEYVTSAHPRLVGLDQWERPPGPWRVALQAGHWRNAEVPEEQKGLRNNSGASGGGKAEWEINLALAEEVKLLLEEYGYAVDVLPTTIPPNYWADVFIAIHADGNLDPSVRGFKVAAPRRDYSGQSSLLAQYLYDAYEDATDLPRDPNVTRAMRGYYAFNWRRYDHSVHPLTPAVILEVGFLTSPQDRQIIVQNQTRAAQGIANAVFRFIHSVYGGA